MNISIEYEKDPQYLFVRIAGKWTTNNAIKVIEEIKIEADRLEMKLILLDLLDLSYPESEMTRFFSGEKIATAFSYQYKIAAYIQQEKFNRFAETTAINRGANIKTFSSKADAIRWLIS